MKNYSILELLAICAIHYLTDSLSKHRFCTGECTANVLSTSLANFPFSKKQFTHTHKRLFPISQTVSLSCCEHELLVLHYQEAHHCRTAAVKGPCIWSDSLCRDSIFLLAQCDSIKNITQSPWLSCGALIMDAPAHGITAARIFKASSHSSELSFNLLRTWLPKSQSYGTIAICSKEVNK